MKTSKEAKRRWKFFTDTLKRYAKEEHTTVRGTSDMSPMEQWLLLRLWEMHEKQNNNNLPHTKKGTIK